MILTRQQALNYKYPYLLFCYSVSAYTKEPTFLFLPLFVTTESANIVLCETFNKYNEVTLNVIYRYIPEKDFKDSILNIRELKFDTLRVSYYADLILPFLSTPLEKIPKIEGLSDYYPIINKPKHLLKHCINNSRYKT